MKTLRKFVVNAARIAIALVAGLAGIVAGLLGVLSVVEFQVLMGLGLLLVSALMVAVSMKALGLPLRGSPDRQWSGEYDGDEWDSLQPSVNPATGLLMTGAVDTAGNPYGADLHRHSSPGL